MADSNTTGTTGAATGAAATTDATKTGTQGQATDQGKTVPITALHEERDKRQALADEVSALKQQLERLATNQQQAQTQTQTQVSQQEQLDALWRTDPKAAMRHELTMAMSWADRVNMSVEDQADTLQSKKEYGDFANHRAEIMRHVRKLPLEQRNIPGVVETAYYLVRGRTADANAGQKVNDAVNRFKMGEGVGAGTQNAGGNAGGADTQAQGLNDQEKAAAMAMGISDDEYLKFRRK